MEADPRELSGPSLRVLAQPGPVSLVRCEDYQLEPLRAALRDLLAPLGGMAAFVKPGERIGLKPNIIMPAAPERAICTHPLLVAAVALEVREAGGYPVVVESPGAGFVPLKSVMVGVFRRAGYREVADRYDFELSYDTDWDTIRHPDGRQAHRVELLRSFLDCDGLINLSKFKTHTFQVLGGATKNLFGLIPGLTKVGYHAKLPAPKLFGDMLLDIAALARPRLNIVDAILAMEGQGPSTSGTPRQMNFLLAADDYVSADLVCCAIAGIDPLAVPMLAAARDRGLWRGRPEDVATVGLPVSAFAVKDFALPGKYLDRGGLGRAQWLADRPRSFMRNGFSPRPRPKVGRCTICGACAQACPGKAIEMDKKTRVALVEDEKCIQCFCCHEVCPNAAIDLEFTGLGKVVHGLGLV
jgi:uncharacterized protein (DUF362 family)/Pyruvate/2-oxoacid:ferredoxin oxidoreductase delta subunit